MRTAIWYSRHDPTPEQLTDARGFGYEIVAIDDGKLLGAKNLQDNGDVKAVVLALFDLIDKHKSGAIFGVPPVPILGQMQRTAADAIERGMERPTQRPGR